MTTAIKRRRGTTAQHSTFTGLEGELTIDTTKDTVVVHDGAVAGGYPLLREDLANNTNVTTNTGTQTLTNKTLTSPTISGGTLNNISIGATTASTGAFTNLAYTGTLTGGTGVINIGSGQLYKDASGNVGIGTSSPVSRLNVAGTTGFTWVGGGTSSGLVTIGTQGTGGSLFVNTASLNSSFASGLAVDGTYSGVSSVVNLKAVGVLSGGGYNASLSFHTSSDTILAERMRIDSAGNVGIGTSSPSQRLHVAGAIAATGQAPALTSSSTFLDYIPSLNVARFAAVGNTTGAAAPIYFSQYSSNGSVGRDAAIIDSSGNVLVGTTTAPAIAGAIHVSNASGHGLQITNSSNGVNRRIYMQSGGDLYFWNGTNEGFLSSAGAWTNASDARLKTNIREIQYGLNTVLASQPRHYERVDVKGTYIGFVAQELQQIIPEVVSGNPEKQLGVDYGSLVAVAFKAIQEQQAIIEQLKTRIEALEGTQP